MPSASLTLSTQVDGVEMGQLNSKGSPKDPTVEVLRKLAGHLSRALKRPT